MKSASVPEPLDFGAEILDTKCFRCFQVEKNKCVKLASPGPVAIILLTRTHHILKKQTQHVAEIKTSTKIQPEEVIRSRFITKIRFRSGVDLKRLEIKLLSQYKTNKMNQQTCFMIVYIIIYIFCFCFREVSVKSSVGNVWKSELSVNSQSRHKKVRFSL